MIAEKYFASIGWPYHLRPAFGLVVQVTWDNEIPDSPYKAEIVTEFEEVGVQTLRERCMGLQEEYKIDSWFCDTTQEGLVGAFYEGGRGDAVALTPPPYVDKGDLSSLCFQAVRELVRTDNKVLYFNQSAIPGHIQNLPQDKPVIIERYPPVAALGYLAAALQLWLQLETLKKPKPFLAKLVEAALRPERVEEDRFSYGINPEDELYARMHGDQELDRLMGY